MNIFNELVQGDSKSWLEYATKDDYGNDIKATEWTLNLFIRGAADLDLVAVASGSDWRFTLSSTDSDGLTPGSYFFQMVATKTGGRVTIGAGKFTVKAKLEDVSGTYDGRSQVKKDLDAVKAAIRSIVAGGAVQEYTIGNRSVKKMSLGELMRLESALKAEVIREEKAEAIANGLGNPNKLLVRFK